MKTLGEIEAATDSLPLAEKEELLLFLAARLRGNVEPPPPREFTKVEVYAWISEDERGMRQFLDRT